MTPEIDKLVDHRWWAGALVQRRKLDALAHEEGRAHQSVDPHAVRRPTGLSGELCEGLQHGDEGYELTDWERTWIRERVIDQFRDRLNDRNQKYGPLLEEPRDAHLARELDRCARVYFDGRSHDEQRVHVRDAQMAHARRERPGDEIDLARGRLKLGEQRDAAQAFLDAHEQERAALAAAATLVDRHIATVTADVDEQRRIAQKALDELDVLLAQDFEALVTHYIERVEQDIRDDPQGCLDIAEGRVPAPL